MEISELGMQAVIIFIVVVLMWVFLRAFRKTMKVVWKVVFAFLILLALSFVLPAVREGILSVLEKYVSF